MEHTVLYNKDSNFHAIYKETIGTEEYVVPDLFPYKMQQRDLFYLRDHPIQLPPESAVYDQYWGDFEKKCIEGHWVEDKGGTWVYMMPKLFYFINYVTIVSASRTRIKPYLRDIEWIMYTFWLCCEGFSGFENDDKYTSHYLAKKMLDGTIDDVEKDKIPPSCFNKKKELKEYVDPWTFLTRTYLIDDPRGPLGRPLYSPSKKSKSNPESGLLDTLNRLNGFILSSRGIGKTLTMFQGIVMHEYTFGGVKFMEDLQNTGRQLIIGLGCGTQTQLERSMNTMKSFYDNQPGKYRYEDTDDPDYMGAFYKNYQGSFVVGKSFQHIIKGGAGGNQIEHFGSTIQSGVLGTGKGDILAGDRQRLIVLEEFGLLGKLLEEVFNSAKDSMKLDKKKVGHLLGGGTGGNLKKIKEPKKVWENPDGYEAFGIPNYWSGKPDKKVGLFISCLYQYRDYDDGQGNINLMSALARFKKDKKKWAGEMDSLAFSSELMQNPLVPRDMLISNARSIYPKREAQHQLSDIEENDLWQKFANTGTLEWSKTDPRKEVKFVKDMDHTNRAITEYSPDFDKVNKAGRFVMFETPSEFIPDYTYFVCYDPTVPKDDDGTSLNGVVVYKHFNSNKGWLSDGIAAVWVGRMPTLEENYEQVIKIAKYFNAKIFVETNTGGFIKWCEDRGHFNMLQADSYRLEKELGQGKWKRNYHQVGCQMTGRKKVYATSKLRDWLMEPRSVDAVTGAPMKRNINLIFSKRILNELINHNPEGNYDLLSCLLLLMILMDQLNYLEPIEEQENIHRDGYNATRMLQKSGRNYVNVKNRRQPSRFESM